MLHLGDIIDGRDHYVHPKPVLPLVLNELDAVVQALKLLPPQTEVLHGKYVCALLPFSGVIADTFQHC